MKPNSVIMFTGGLFTCCKHQLLSKSSKSFHGSSLLGVFLTRVPHIALRFLLQFGCSDAVKILPAEESSVARNRLVKYWDIFLLLQHGRRR